MSGSISSVECFQCSSDFDSFKISLQFPLEPDEGLSGAPGNGYLRRLLVQAAQYVLGPFGPDSQLRRWGLQLAGSGGPRGKKRAVVAVARKLAVLLHHLWRSGQNYRPFPQAHSGCARP